MKMKKTKQKQKLAKLTTKQKHWKFKMKYQMKYKK